LPRSVFPRQEEETLSPLVVFTALALIATDAASIATAAHHVRALNPGAQRVIDDGVTYSPSVRALIERLEGSDVIVYVQEARAPIGSMHGSLTFVSNTGMARYLLIRLFGRSRMQQVSILGHELQHAVEIAERPDIVDEVSLMRAYARFGTVIRSNAAGGTHLADTAAAVAMARRVWREVARPRGVSGRREK
jgi:hypothetical protein